jgi:hypothetical protein
MKFVERRTTVEALLFNGKNVQEVINLLHPGLITYNSDTRVLELNFPKRNLNVVLQPDTYILYGYNRFDFTTLSAEEFEAKYEPETKWHSLGPRIEFPLQVDGAKAQATISKFVEKATSSQNQNRNL